MYETDTELFLKEALQKNKWSIKDTLYRPELLLGRSIDKELYEKTEYDYLTDAKKGDVTAAMAHFDQALVNAMGGPENLAIFGLDDEDNTWALARYWAATKDKLKIGHSIRIPRRVSAANKDTAEQLENMIAGHASQNNIKECIHLWELVPGTPSGYDGFLNPIAATPPRLERRFTYEIKEDDCERTIAGGGHEHLALTPKQTVKQIVKDIQYVLRVGFKDEDDA